ncbi:hypothetical protein GCM10011344_23600 [Dokdonia pacifica]|uniref:NB-ARC domain-containing protein n=1 Tax=Dokdonia pacifica TaxID=1627892 RepID=A0A238WL09_9FLAO|nr:tetratricopeptide repeat protein [Dokdonia pacifica]GGG22161.1 hypothetical protein GCM10011344_23600 [Dokdonia pacifica]SNR47222.1 NB-ARC domain-containing protein [Dokdonia pacifica]
MTIESILIYVGKSIARLAFKTALKNKITPLFGDKESYEASLYHVILKTIEDFEKEHPSSKVTGKFPFYKSHLLFDALSRYVLFNEGSKETLDIAFKENTNIIPPTKEELEAFYQLFLDNVVQDQKLKDLFISENYQKQIFSNTEKLKSLINLTTSVKDDTQEIIKRLDGGVSSQIPKELTTLLPKLEKRKIVGRRSELEKLKKSLFDNKQVVLVNGMGGIGKTTLATVYLTEFFNEYNHIAWISATQNGFYNDVVAAAGLLESLRIELGGTPEETYNAVKAKLNSLKGKNLLIIDNATEDLAIYASYLPSQPKWHLLVTSREKIDFFDTMEIGFLSEPEAVQLFKEHYKYQKLQNKDIKELVAGIEYHTLTIEILAKTAQELRMSPTALNAAIVNNMETDIITRHRNKKIGKILSYLTAVFDMSELTKDGITVLKYISVLPSEYLQNEDLEEVLSFLPDILPRGRAELLKKGWVLYNPSEDAYKLHQIIQEVVKSKFTHDAEFLEPLIISLQSVLSFNIENKDNPISKFKWIPYGKTFLKQFEENTAINVSTIQNNLGLILRDLGDYVGAKGVLEKSVESHEKYFGEDHPNTISSYSNFALFLQDIGDYRGAKNLIERVVSSDEKNFGEDHPNTAISYSILGLVLKDLKDYRGAKNLLEKALVSDEKNFGDHHLNTATSYLNLATTLRGIGDYEGAKDLMEKAMSSYERNLGMDHPYTTTSYSNLALVLQDLGNYEGAKDLLEKAIASDIKNFGEHHPATANRYSNLATVHKDLGNYEGAKVLLEKAYQIFLNKLGGEHPNTKIVKGNLSVIIKEMENQ